MPIVLQPVTQISLTRDKVRQFMRDVPGLVPNTGVVNILLDNVEFSDDDIDSALEFTADLFSTITPILGIYTFVQIPRIILLYGVASHLLTSESMRQLRNHATTQDGDVQPIGIDDKMEAYANMAKWLNEKFMDLAVKAKVQWNLRGAFGGLGSGYQGVARNHST